MKRLGFLLIFMALMASPALARGHHHHHRHHHHVTKHAPAHRDLVTVPTAAGIAITVGRDVATNFQGLISDLVDLGYHPHEISCWAPGGTHVEHSRHYIGHACDFDQTGWNATARIMYSERVTELAHKWGFVSGCEFHHPRKDCGHIGDDFTSGRQYARHRFRHYARG